MEGTEPADTTKEDIMPSNLSFLTADFFTSAISSARSWLEDGTLSIHDNAEMNSDFEAALDAFNEAVDEDDFGAALDACRGVSLDWASNDESGFADLVRVVELIGKRVEARTGVAEDDDDGVILGFRWNLAEVHGLIVGWDTGTQCDLPLGRLDGLHLAD